MEPPDLFCEQTHGVDDEHRHALRSACKIMHIAREVREEENYLDSQDIEIVEERSKRFWGARDVHQADLRDN